MPGDRRVSAAAVQLLLLLLLLGTGDCVRFRFWADNISLPARQYTELVSTATEYCYRKLVNDSNCCLDEAMTPGLKRRTLRRPGSEWTCKPPACKSGVVGRRGDDNIWVPPDADCFSPRILYIHGGSWMYGSPVSSGYDEFTARIADATGAMVMTVDYPLVSLRQPGSMVGDVDDIMNASIMALRWLAENGPVEGCPEKAKAPLFLGGDSSGGGTGLSLAVLLGMKPWLLEGRRLAGVFLYSPWTNLLCNSPEYYHNAFSKIEENTYNNVMSLMRRGANDTIRLKNLTAYVGDVIFRTPPSQNSWRFEMNAVGYVGNKTSRLTDPVASPYYAGAEQLAGLPPLYIAVGSSESIFGDSVVVAQNAAASGVDVHLDVHPGMWHVFPMYSEGCGGGTPLWSGVRAMNSTALFVRHISEAGRPPYTVSMQGPLDTPNVLKQPHTTISYGPQVPSFVERDAEVGHHLLAVRALQKQRQRARAAK